MRLLVLRLDYDPLDVGGLDVGPLHLTDGERLEYFGRHDPVEIRHFDLAYKYKPGPAVANACSLSDFYNSDEEHASSATAKAGGVGGCV